jgi:hypothetical protein
VAISRLDNYWLSSPCEVSGLGHPGRTRESVVGPQADVLSCYWLRRFKARRHDVSLRITVTTAIQNKVERPNRAHKTSS